MNPANSAQPVSDPVVLTETAKRLVTLPPKNVPLSYLF
jgi:hypothetical protein